MKRIALILAMTVIMVGTAIVVGSIATRDVVSPAGALETTTDACDYWTWDWFWSDNAEWWYWQYYRTCYGPGGVYTEWGDWDWW